VEGRNGTKKNDGYRQGGGKSGGIGKVRELRMCVCVCVCVCGCRPS